MRVLSERHLIAAAHLLPRATIDLNTTLTPVNPSFATGSGTFSGTPARQSLPLGTNGTVTETITFVDPTAVDQFMTGLAGDRLYVNIDTTNVPSGEIRGDFPAIPEPGTLLLFGSGVIGALAFRLRRRLP